MIFANMKPEEITPQSFESNDGRLSVKIIEENLFELTTTELSNDQANYMREGYDCVQKLSFHYDEIDRIIEILEYTKRINPYSWETVKEMQEKECSKKFDSWD